MSYITTNKDQYKNIGVIQFFVLVFTILTLSTTISFAQDEVTRVIVEPDDFPATIGALNIAIETNGADVVYVLRNGGTYFLDASIQFDHAIQLEAEVFPSDNPPIIRPGTDLTGGSNRIGRYNGDFTAKGIFFLALDDLGGYQENQRTNAEGLKLHYQHCYFASGNNYFFRLQSRLNTLRIEDSQFANGGRYSSHGNQRWIDMRGQDQDSIIVTNSSVYQTYDLMFRSGGSKANYVYLDHITFVNQGDDIAFDFHISKEITVKNSLFVNFASDGTWESAELVGDAGPYYDGERLASVNSGFMTITSYEGLLDSTLTSDSDRKIVIKNNTFARHTDEIVAFWDAISTDGDGDGTPNTPYITDPQWLLDNPDVSPDSSLWATRDTIPAVRIAMPAFDSTLQSWSDPEVAPWATIENNISETVVINDMPDIERFVDFLTAIHYGNDNPHHEDRWEDISEDEFTRYFHPGPGTPTEPTDSTAAWFRDLSYNTDSESYTHAEDGYPVGSLVFFPELREKWGNGEVLTSVDDITEQPTRFTLEGNYPNPFNPTTNIKFEIASSTEVTLEIFNILGQRVEVMNLGKMSSGKHQVTFDASHLTSGTYLVRMKTNAGIQTHSMTLLK